MGWRDGDAATQPNQHTVLTQLRQCATKTGLLTRERAIKQLIDAGGVVPAAHDLLAQVLRKGALVEDMDDLQLTDSGNDRNHNREQERA